ncbi:MAG: hypothetical protein GX376_08150 [Firmicutes bacterium]|nr:hypothetical protein [Bacillota bacterium]
MNTIREHIGVSLQGLEIELPAIMREQFGKALNQWRPCPRIRKGVDCFPQAL